MSEINGSDSKQTELVDFFLTRCFDVHLLAAAVKPKLLIVK